MPIYKNNGVTYNIPDDKAAGFEAKFPGAMVALENEGVKYELPVSKKKGFMEKFPGATYSVAAPPAPKAEDINPTSDKSGYTLTAAELGLPGSRSESTSVAKLPEIESPEEQNAPLRTADDIRRSMLPSWRRDEETEEPKVEVDAMTGESVKSSPQRLRITEEVGTYYRPNVGTDSVDETMNVSTKGLWRHTKNRKDASDKAQAAKEKYGEHSPEYLEAQEKLALATLQEAEAEDPNGLMAHIAQAERERLREEKSRIERVLDALNKRAAKRRNEITTNAGAFVYGMAPVTGNQMAEITDSEMTKITAAISNNEEALLNIDRQLRGEKPGFWTGVLDATLRNPDFYTMNLSSLQNTRAELSVGVNGIKDDLDREVAESMVTRDEHAVDNGFWYDAGHMGGTAIPFVVSMALNPAQGTIRGGSKVAAGVARKTAANSVKRRIIKALGTTADDFAEAAVVASSTGAPMTIENIGKRMTGQAVRTETGGIKFVNQEALPSAIYKGALESIFEFYTEKVGGHIDKWVGKKRTKLLESMSASHVSKALLYIKESDFVKTSNQVLRNMGVNDVGSEILEEELNILLNGTFIDPEAFKGLVDPEVQVDIIGGMCLTIGLTRAIPGTVASVGYIKQSRRLKRAEDVASSAFGAKWEKVKSDVENATNEEIAKVVNGYMSDDQIANIALRDYYAETMKMRGYNIGTTKRKYNIPSAERSYQEGYEAADEQKGVVKQAYDMERERVLNTFGEEVVQRLDDDPVGALMELNEIDRQEAIGYVNAKTAYEGMIDHISDDIDERIKASDKEIESHANRQDGAIHPAMMRGVNGAAPKRVYIVNGNVATFEDGTIDKANSSSMIIVRDAETGEVAAASADDLESLDAVIDTEAEKKTVAEQIANEYAGQQAAIIEGESGKLTYNSNDGVHTVEILGENGDVFTILDNGVERIATREWVDELKAQNGVVSPVEDQIGDNTGKVVESSPTGEAAAPVVEAPKTALEQIPRNEKNVPLYEQVDSELAWDGVVEEAGGNEETAMVAVNSMIADKKAALKKAEKAKAKAGVTIAEKIAAENERVANIEKAKADLAKWEEIAGVKAKRALAAENVAQPVAEELTNPVKTEDVNAETVATGEEVSPVEEIEPPQATNEMQEADLTEDVKTEDVNQSENNLEMVAEGSAPGDDALSPAFATQERKGGTITLHTKTETKKGVKTTRVVAMRNGSEVSMPTAAFPVPEGMTLTDIPEGVEVTGVKELREGNDGKTAATVSVKYEDGGLDTMETRVVKPAGETTVSQPSDQVGDQVAENGVRLSDEVDENGRQFVLNSNGDIVFGEIAEDSGLTPAPILLSEGLITNPATNDGYGLVHIEARHGDQIRKAGYNSVVEFVEEVAKNYEVIREGKDRDGHQTYMLQLTDKHNNTLMVELSGDGTYWNINTAGIFKTSYGKNRKEVYNRHTTAKQSTETVEASQDAEQSGTQATSSMNAPTTSSASEDRNSVSNSQENAQKSGEIAENVGERMYSQEELAETKEQLGELNATSAPNFAVRLFSIRPWGTLEEANAALKELLASYGETLNGQTAAVLPFLDEAQRLISENSKNQEPRSVEEDLDNGDKRITNYNSRGEVATVATERDGKIVSVDSYDEGVLYRSSEEAVQTAEEFNRVHKGAAPTIIIDSIETLEDQLRNAEFSEEDIEFSKRNFYNELAYYHPTYDVIVINKHDVSKEELIGYLWHENAHNAIGKIFTSEETERMFNIIYGPEAPKVKAALAKAGYKPHQQAEEGIVMGIEKCFLDKDVLKRIKDGRMKPKEDVDEDAIFAIDYINKTVRFINNGTEQENGNDRAGRDKNNAGEGAPAVGGGQTVEMRDSKEEGESTSTTGGLTESEIALLEASTGYTREEIIDMFGYDLSREGAGPLTDREVVMESDPYPKVLGKPRYYGKRQREFVARQRRRMAEKARQVAEKLNLNNVEVLESTEGLTGKKATSKGWFDPKTGKITVVVPNHGSTGDIVETVLHEAAAHYGLRKLFGENFKNFLDNVYRNVTPEIRAEITELAKKHGWDFHTATEEYLASLAENTNFERVNPSLWSNIKSFFMKMLAKVGITLDEPLGDNELRYILWRSHQNLVNPGWFNVFGQAEDIAKQYELGVGNYASGEVKTENGDAAAEDDSALLHREGGVPGSARKEYERKVRRPNKSGSVGATENVARRAQEAYQDSMLALKILQDAVARETGNEVKDNENAYIAENRMSSSNKAMVEIYERDFFMPLMDEINALIKEGVEYDDIIRYLHAKHGLERNEYMRRKQAEEAARRELGEEPAMPNEGDADYEAKVNAKAAWRENLAELTESYVKKFAKRDYSGLTALTETANAKDAEAAAQQMVDEFEKDHDTTPLWEAVNKATKETLRREFVGGLIDRATYDTVSTMFDFYIPLRGWDENVAANEYEYFTNNNTPVFTPAIKTMHGRKSLSDDPIATIGYMAGSAIARANRNLMKQKFLNFVMNNPTSLATVSEQWYTMDYGKNEWTPNNPGIPEDATPEQVVEIVEAHEANMRALEKAGLATRKRSGLKVGLHTTKQEEHQHVVRVMRNGKEYAVYINGNPRAAQALNGMTNPDVSKSKAREAAQKVKNFMARAFTSRNLAFIFSNSVRDVIWAGTVVAAKEDAEYTKQYTKNVTGVLAKFKLPRLLWKFQNGTLDMNNEVERYFDEFLRNGGETGFTQVLTVEDYKRNIKRFTKEAKKAASVLGKVGRIPKKGWRSFWNGVEFLNRSAEDITRFTVYMTSRQMGRSIARSVYDAKEVTVNFNKKGSGEMGAKYLNFAYLFFNATIQSIANFGKLVYRHPGKMAAMLGTFGMMGFLMPVINAALMAIGDDDDMENYWNLPEWVRRNNIVLFVPWTEKSFITIPLPHELRPFYGMGENAMSALLGKQTTGDAIKKSLVGFTGMLPIDFTANGGDVVVNVMPTILQPLAQVRANVTHFGTPIYKDNDFNKRYPSWTKAYKGTNSTLVAATKWLNELGGGNNVDSGGLLDWNPAVIEHLFESYLGGMGKTFNKAATTVSMIWDEEARIARNIPVVSSFYQESDERTAGSQLNREYFDALEEMEGFQHRLSGYQKEITKGNAEYEKLFEDLVNSDEFMRYSIIKDYSNAIRELDQVLKNNGPTEKEAQEIEGVIQKLKKEMLDELEKLQAEE